MAKISSRIMGAVMTQIDEPKEESIQPIKSHTEILIQQAYDRGYADKAMKVDQAIEMEHSPKDCTLPCHVHQDTTSIDEQIQQILRDFDNTASIYAIEVKARYETAKAQVRELMANQLK